MCNPQFYVSGKRPMVLNMQCMVPLNKGSNLGLPFFERMYPSHGFVLLFFSKLFFARSLTNSFSSRLWMDTRYEAVCARAHEYIAVSQSSSSVLQCNKTHYDAVHKRECHTGGHYWYYYTCTISYWWSHCNLLEDRVTIDWSDWIRMIGYLDNWSGNGRHATCPICCLCIYFIMQ